MKLNEKHKLFADEYINNGYNATKAYMTVYKTDKERVAEASASRLLSKVIIADYIKERQKEAQEELKIDREYIIKEYLDLITSCKIEGNDGEGTIKDRANWSKALAQLSKMLGLDAPEKHEHTILQLGNININLTDDTDTDTENE
jgi:phage terminase small subunit